jgi:RimJ/RimL family protein N-acetyltransferase
MNIYPIKIGGTLCEGQMLSIGWPNSTEFDKITNLRNKASVRKYFLDNRVLDTLQNRKWLESGMKRPKEALLSIRFKVNNCFLGTVGWSDWDVEMKTACFGRLMIDHAKVKEVKHLLPKTYKGIAIDACMTLRDFAMTKMEIEFLRTYLFVNNTRAKKVNTIIGLEEIKRSTRQQTDGTNIDTIEMLLTKAIWENIKQVQNR